MKISLIWALLAAATAAACGDGSGPSAMIPSELVGEWHADAACAPTCNFTLTWKDNPAAKLDAINLGMALRMDIEANGRFRFGDVTAMPPAGQVRVSGNEMVVTDAEGTIDTIDYRMETVGLRLDFRREFLVVSFNGDTIKDPSTASAVFVKR